MLVFRVAFCEELIDILRVVSGSIVLSLNVGALAFNSGILAVC
jgi:hypothetical protein